MDEIVSTPVKTSKNLKSAILRTFLYFDIFHYPITREQAYNFCSLPSSSGDFEIAFKDLVETGCLKKLGKFYAITADSGIALRRARGNELAAKRLKLARRISGFIGQFPFVRGVMLSGSLSKGYMDPDSDIDYFIITKPGRLWVARTFG